MTETLQIDIQSATAVVTLNRPQAGNAFNPTMISELTETFRTLSANPEVRVAILKGNGKNFCAGADLNWMKEAANYKKKKNILDSLDLHRMFLTLYQFPKPLIVQTHGAVYGGGVGLTACADVVVSSEETVFSLSEVRLGILPAVISPFVIRKMGASMFRAFGLSGKKFSTQEALKFDLIHQAVPFVNLEKTTASWVSEFLQNSPQAMGSFKKLLWEIDAKNVSFSRGKTVRAIAKARSSKEAREGFAAFFEKRNPSWKK